MAKHWDSFLSHCSYFASPFSKKFVWGWIHGCLVAGELDGKTLLAIYVFQIECNEKVLTQAEPHWLRWNMFNTTWVPSPSMKHAPCCAHNHAAFNSLIFWPVIHCVALYILTCGTCGCIVSVELRRYIGTEKSLHGCQKFLLHMGPETRPSNEWVKYATSIDEADMYPLMVLVAFEILQGDGYLYGVVVSFQSQQLVDQVWPVFVTANSRGILHTSTIQLILANDADE